MRNEARYLIRFDDICPTMNWSTWESIEKILRAKHVKPIMAVVPDNRDENLMVAPPKMDFWDQVRKWQQWGWTLGLHGYQHRYETKATGILGLNRSSEFAGVPEEEQMKRLKKGAAIFKRENLFPDLWVAPGHSFDKVTISLLKKIGIGIVSDGFAFYPYIEDDLIWVPQQLWKFTHKTRGVWTVCYHHNGMNNDDIETLRMDLELYENKLVHLKALLRSSPLQNGRSLADSLLGSIIKSRVRMSRFKANFLKEYQGKVTGKWIAQ